MVQQKEVKYVLCSENTEGIGVIHKEAICHIAYATALDALGVSSFLTNEQIRKFTNKKTNFSKFIDGIDIEVHIPIKRDLNAYHLMEKAQKEIQQNFSDLLGIKVRKIDLVIDQVLF
ncbi:MAG: hypothetical protein ACRC6X_07115 [Culicoidibacterales bacterium]